MPCLPSPSHHHKSIGGINETIPCHGWQSLGPALRWIPWVMIRSPGLEMDGQKPNWLILLGWLIMVNHPIYWPILLFKKSFVLYNSTINHWGFATLRSLPEGEKTQGIAGQFPSWPMVPAGIPGCPSFFGKSPGDDHLSCHVLSVCVQYIRWYGYGSIPIHSIFRGMNIHKSQLFWCELQGDRVLTHPHMML